MQTPEREKSGANSRKMVGLIVALVVAIVLVVGGVSVLLPKWFDSPGTEEGKAPDPATAQNREWTGSMDFNGQQMEVTLFGDKAPAAVASFLHLAKTDYFVDISCHRLTTGGFDILQCGDPTGTGSGGPGYEFGPIENAPADNMYARGTLAMARTPSPDSHGSQFFIVYGDTMIPRDTAGGYTVFGEITGGLEAVDAVAKQGTSNGQQDGPPAAPAVLGAVRFQS